MSYLDHFDLTHAHIQLKNGKVLDCYIDGAQPYLSKKTSIKNVKRVERAYWQMVEWKKWNETILDKVWQDLERSGIRREEVYEIMICRDYSGSVHYRDKTSEVA